MSDRPSLASSLPTELPGTPGNSPEYTVSELSGAIKRTLESGFEHVRVRGELGRISRPASGHVYLDLKDERSVISGVIWKGTATRLRFEPEQGLEVIVTGRLTTFPGQSKYQIVIESIEPAGLGALMALLEARKKQFAEEGLFDEARKKPLPFLPRIVGIVTSPTGAVIRDMLHGFDERFPTRVIVWPVRVQGETCATEVASAIRGFNALPPADPVPRPDVLIVARGGGSLEDLWGFNEEVVVRAAAESELPLISAVGHETDWTLIDLAADARAPTPTKAAEWAVPKRSELLDRLAQNGVRLQVGIHRKIESISDRLKAAARVLPRRDVLLAEPRQRLDRCEHRLTAALVASTSRSSLRLARVSSRIAPRLLVAQISRFREAATNLDNRSRQALMRTTSQRRARFEGMIGRLRPSTLHSRVRQARERLTGLEARARQANFTAQTARRQRLSSLSKLFESLSYQGVLARGFALVRDSHGKMVRSSKVLTAGAGVEIEFADGRVEARVEGPGQPAGGSPPPAKKSGILEAASPSTDGEARRPSRKRRDPDQGRLL